MQIDNVIDPSLPHGAPLAPPQQGSRPRTALENTAGNLDPLARFYADAPWSTQNTRSSNGIADNRPYCPQHHSSANHGQCRAYPISESDSGYVTRQGRSVISNEPKRVDQEIPSEVTMQVGNMNVNAVSVTSEHANIFHVASTDYTSQYSGKSTNQPGVGGKEFRCEHCKKSSKCQSDYKKHMLKHDKPFKCEVTDCRRGGKGFTTENDLMRHKKSVHRIGMQNNSWQCASNTCRNRGKIWPRLDNFKQHIHRMHRDEDAHDLITKSVYQHQPPSQSSSQSLSVAPMDTTLAGIGTGKQFGPGNDYDDPTVPGISLTPDQGSSNLTISNNDEPVSPLSLGGHDNEHDYTMDVDQTSPHEFGGHDNRTTVSTMGLQAGLNGFELRNGSNQRASNLDRLDTLTALASTQDNTTPLPPPPPQLSNAPQTKAEQQQQALQKLCKSLEQGIKNSTDGEIVDLEHVIKRVLSGATTPSKKDNHATSHSADGSPASDSSSSSECSILTKGEALRASQAIYNLIKQSSKPAPSRSRSRLVKGFSKNTKRCEVCSTTLARSCDMRKHMKRHTKPYGCTYPKCHRRFGAKSDWKRHEGKLHFQVECFRCSNPSSSTPSSSFDTSGLCGELFFRPEQFKSHLSTHHNLTQFEEHSSQLRASRIGRNGQGQFWCGFCKCIVKLAKKREEAWDERFDHIDAHFMKQGKSIEDWLCIEDGEKKGTDKEVVDKGAFDDEEDEDDEDMHDGAETVKGGEQGRRKGPPSNGDAIPTAHTRSSAKDTLLASPSSKMPRKRHAEHEVDDDDGIPSSAAQHPRPQKRAKRDELRFCCMCQSGPWTKQLYSGCMTLSCNHHFCDNCEVFSGGILENTDKNMV
ncbi:hypothetical protein K504DRAFT_42150 [Pleomassaria siparia CBS 279.74]|uniref:C2H2-type domain-containing protein n=1 Tax=Pleomassaria siparia CBS 279.74 TaxID=1314801 RepID=A0A6G1K5C8_9PLEO|nr:hypothetical protein K504DRAFT_42150 [Pleomassaria siparia CBS 279.74]